VVWCSQCSYKTTRIASKLHTQNSCIKPDATSGNKFEFPFTQWWMCKHNMETNSDRLVDGKQVPTGMHPDLVQTGYYRFLLTSCLTQDTLENLFSQICGCGDSHPTPVKLRHNIWLISISQFAKTPKNGSYDSADDVHLLSLYFIQNLMWIIHTMSATLWKQTWTLMLCAQMEVLFLVPVNIMPLHTWQDGLHSSCEDCITWHVCHDADDGNSVTELCSAAYTVQIIWWF